MLGLGSVLQGLKTQVVREQQGIQVCVVEIWGGYRSDVIGRGTGLVHVRRVRMTWGAI